MSTRVSDIYSLGVLLYELLTGSTPLEGDRLRSAAFDEILRIISEEDPPRPSIRLSSSQSLPSIAASRSLEPKKLTGLIRGELDWIVMKCLEKDRNRRYETANGLAMELQRYLNDEAVSACPPSAIYRLRKFTRRNKTALTVVASILCLLVFLGGGNRVGHARPLDEASRLRTGRYFLRWKTLRTSISARIGLRPWRPSNAQKGSWQSAT